MAATIPTSRTEAETLFLASSNYRWATTGTAQVEQYIVAAEYLIMHTPKRVTHGGRGGEEIQTNVEELRDLLKQAEQFRASSVGAGVAYLDFGEYRR